MTRDELIAYYAIHDRLLARIYTGATPDAPCRLAGITAGIAFPEPYHYACDEETTAHFAAGVALARRNLAREAEQLSDDGIFRPLIIEHHLYGVHFMGTLWNVPAFFRDGQWWNKALPTPVGTLWEPELESHPTVTLMETLGRLLVEGTENHTFISMQVFAAPLNLVVDLYGERLLEALALDPEAAEHDIEVATRTIIAMHRRWMQLIPAARLRNFAAAGRYMPAGYGIIDGCTTQLVSPDTYRRFFMERDNRILSLYPHGGMIHLCGAAEQHIPAFRAMPALKAVQLNDRAAEAFEQYYEGLRDDQVIYFNTLPEHGAEEILHYTGGRRVVIV